MSKKAKSEVADESAVVITDAVLAENQAKLDSYEKSIKAVQERRRKVIIDSKLYTYDKLSQLYGGAEGQALLDAVTAEHTLIGKLTASGMTYEQIGELIKERITSLTEMLDDLFTFTKLKNDAYELELSSVNLTAILKETILSYYEDWLAKGINPNINITEKSCIINGNDLAVRRVIQNIIKNVLVHGNDEISISLESEMNVNLIISNKIDNPEKIEIDKIFDRFYKADESRTVSSSGLGLSIAYELVRHMKGSIEADINGNIFSIKIMFGSISKNKTKK